MGRELRDWRPKEGPVCPAADHKFLELSSAKAWGKTPEEWYGLSVINRAEMLAHDLIESTRNGYEQEKQMEKAERKQGGDRPRDPLSSMRDAFSRGAGPGATSGAAKEKS